MKFAENSDEIIIRHVPVREWVIGGILLFFPGIFCLLLYHASTSLQRSSPGFNLSDWLESSFFSVFAAAGIVWLYFGIKMIRAPLVIITISRETKSIDILRQRFYGSKAERFYFFQIQKFKSHKIKTNFSSKYILTLILANKKTIELKIPVGNDKLTTIKLIKKLNKFIKINSLSEEKFSASE